MKTIFLYIIILTSLTSFGQRQDSIHVNDICMACLSKAKVKDTDTLDCYPVATKAWLDIVKTTYDKLIKKLDTTEKKKLYGNQMRWENSKNVEYDQYNLIIADKSRPLPERRFAVKKEFQIAQDRGLYLLKYLKAVTDK